jgi:hypothetical protein
VSVKISKYWETMYLLTEFAPAIATVKKLNTEFPTVWCRNIKQLAEIPVIARDSIRNEGTREINYGSCISASRPELKPPGEKPPVLIG